MQTLLRGLRFITAAHCLSILLAVGAAETFDYPHQQPVDVRVESSTTHGAATLLDVSYEGLSGKRIAAYLVVPRATGQHPGILFVHWLGPIRSDRTEYLEEALTLAERGAESLLIDAMWAEPGWFEKRNQAADLENSIVQVKELRRALDVLQERPGIDRKRMAFVGHDFGAMFGAVLASADRRVCAWALQAGTTSFSDWYLLHPKLEGAERERFVQQLSVLDPVRFIGAAAPAPVLLQFSSHDQYVPPEKAERFFQAASEPKEIHFYEAGHALDTAAAVSDRGNWLCSKLGLTWKAGEPR
jgi:dienelactone hydrolase